jgi:hypothetical protein
MWGRAAVTVVVAVAKNMLCEVPTTAAELPVWIEWMKGLGSVLVAALALLVSTLTFRLSHQIARWQASVAKAQLRQNVYDRRFAVYQSAKALLIALQYNGTLSGDDYMEYRRGTVDAVFLLDAGVVAYLDQLRERAERLLLVRNLIKENSSGCDAYHRNVDESAQIENWFGKQFDVLLSKFKPCVRLEEP